MDDPMPTHLHKEEYPDLYDPIPLNQCLEGDDLLLDYADAVMFFLGSPESVRAPLGCETAVPTESLSPGRRLMEWSVSHHSLMTPKSDAHGIEEDGALVTPDSPDKTVGRQNFPFELQLPFDTDRKGPPESCAEGHPCASIAKSPVDHDNSINLKRRSRTFFAPHADATSNQLLPVQFNPPERLTIESIGPHASGMTGTARASCDIQPIKAPRNDSLCRPAQQASTTPIPTARKRPPRWRVQSTTNDYVTPRDVDILFGRGYRTGLHPGNVRFRCAASDWKERYKAAESQSDKTTAVSQEFVDMVKGDGWNGRFLKQDESTHGWFEVSDDRAREKVRQKLQDLLKPPTNQNQDTSTAT